MSLDVDLRSLLELFIVTGYRKIVGRRFRHKRQLTQPKKLDHVQSQVEHINVERHFSRDASQGEHLTKIMRTKMIVTVRGSKWLMLLVLTPLSRSRGTETLLDLATVRFEQRSAECSAFSTLSATIKALANQ